jgi:hypothetical protein
MECPESLRMRARLMSIQTAPPLIAPKQAWPKQARDLPEELSAADMHRPPDQHEGTPMQRQAESQADIRQRRGMRHNETLQPSCMRQALIQARGTSMRE